MALFFIHSLLQITINAYSILLIFFILAFLLGRTLYISYKRPVSNQKKTARSHHIIWAIIIYLSFAVMVLFYISHEPSSKFDAAAWATEKTKRFEMGDDIVNSNLLIGKDSNAVKTLLGSPTYRDSLNSTWNYNMGMGGGGLGFLFHDLQVNFKYNTVGTVVHFKIKD